MKCPVQRGVLISGVNLAYLGHSKVSLLQRCPYFRGFVKSATADEYSDIGVEILFISYTKMSLASYEMEGGRKNGLIAHHEFL